LFNRFQIENQIETAFLRNVNLPSGGSIVIDPTEALVSIDINSARATKGADIEDTAFQTNKEAAVEIARQLRLRDMGGLVVIDFIDMSQAKHQREVENVLRKALTQDRARVQVGKISRFGLLEMSRQRLKPSLGESAHGVCPRCDGTGTIRGVQSLALSILRLVEEEAAKDSTSLVQAILPVPVATFLLNEKRKIIAAIEKRQNTLLVIIPNPYMETPNYEIKRLRKSESLETESYKVPKQPELEIVTSSQEANIVKPPEQAAVTTLEAPAAPQHVAKKEAKKPSLLVRMWRSLFSNEENEKDSNNKGNQRYNNRNRNNRNRNNRNQNSRNRNNRNRNQNTERNSTSDQKVKTANTDKIQQGNDSKDSKDPQNRNPRGNRNNRSPRGRNNQRGNNRNDRTNSQETTANTTKVNEPRAPRPARKPRDQRRQQVQPEETANSVTSLDTASNVAANAAPVKSVDAANKTKQSAKPAPVISEAKPHNNAADQNASTNQSANTASPTPSTVDGNVANSTSETSTSTKAESNQKTAIASSVKEQSKSVGSSDKGSPVKVSNTESKQTSDVKTDTKADVKKDIKPEIVADIKPSKIVTPSPVVIETVAPSVPRKSYSATAKATNPDVLISVDFGFKAKTYSDGEKVTIEWQEPANICKSYSPMTKPNLEQLLNS
ncbi:MAG: ribonuclease E/G, partial [Enterobacterales bacterium]|nr:ribonuclease E/G [Enterobacterales bacterium]